MIMRKKGEFRNEEIAGRKVEIEKFGFLTVALATMF